MAEVYRTIGGKQLDDWLAHTEMVRNVIAIEAADRMREAARIHAYHRKEGHSFIHLERGGLDWFVVLNDTRGLAAAMSIEFGRGGSEPSSPDGEAVGAWQGTNTLHRAFGIPMERTFPRSKRRKRFNKRDRRRRRR